MTLASDPRAAASPPDTYIDGSTNEVRVAEPSMVPAPSANPWPDVRARENQLLSVRLSPLGAGRSAFCVSTYHMPCVFWHDDFMRIHGALAAQVGRSAGASIWRGGTSRALACPPRLLLTLQGRRRMSCAGTGTRRRPLDCTACCERRWLWLRATLAPVPPLPSSTSSSTQGAGDVPAEAVHGGARWRPAVRPLRSALAVAAGGTETPFTTQTLKVADAAAGRADFRATLDYIFVSSQWDVTGASPPPPDIGRSPSATEPSDHALIAAELELPLLG